MYSIPSLLRVISIKSKGFEVLRFCYILALIHFQLLKAQLFLHK